MSWARPAEARALGLRSAMDPALSALLWTAAILAWSLIARGPSPGVSRARAASAQAMAAFDALGLPSSRSVAIMNFVAISPARVDSLSRSMLRARLCATFQGVAAGGSGPMGAQLGDWGAKASVEFATLHEAGHCSWERIVAERGLDPAEMASAALRGWPGGPERGAAAAAWLARAWNESYADLIGMAGMARELPADGGRFGELADMLAAKRVLNHVEALDPDLGSSRMEAAALSKLDVHFTQFALQEAVQLGQARLRSMDGPELEAWALDASLRATARGMRGAPEFAWIGAKGPAGS